MMRKILTLFLIFSCTWASGQAVDWDSQVPATWLKGATVSPDHPEIIGSPYLFESWQPASLIMTSGRHVKDIAVNFINQTGELVVSKVYAGEEVKYGIVESDIESVTLAEVFGNKKRHFVRFRADTLEGVGSPDHFFYEVLNNGPASFLKKPFKHFVRARVTEAYSYGKNKAKYILKNQYFLRVPGQSGYTEVRLTKHTILAAMGAQWSSRARALMKENSWRWNQEEDLAKMLDTLFQ